MCVNGDNGQKSCQCNTGYQGEDCSEKTLPRTYSPSQCESCENGDCNQINGVFRCVCHEGWSGKQCSIQDSCQRYKCNKGKCHLNSTNQPQCKCQHGYAGKHCEIHAKSCRLRRHTGSYTHSESNKKKCTIENIERNFCEGTKKLHTRKHACGQGFECSEVTEDRLQTLHCNDGTTVQKRIPFVLRCECKRPQTRLSALLTR